MGTSPSNNNQDAQQESRVVELNGTNVEKHGLVAHAAVKNLTRQCDLWVKYNKINETIKQAIMNEVQQLIDQGSNVPRICTVFEPEQTVETTYDPEDEMFEDMNQKQIEKWIK